MVGLNFIIIVVRVPLICEKTYNSNDLASRQGKQ